MKFGIHKKINITKKMHAWKNAFSSIGTNPFTDWKIVFFVASFLIILGFAFGALTFYRVNNGTLYDMEQRKVIKVTTLDRKALSDIIEFFSLKEAKYNSLKQQRDFYVDPSL